MKASGGRSRLSRREFVTVAAPLVLAGCAPLQPERWLRRQSETVRRLRLLYTNDEHGWMLPGPEHGGAAGMLYQWQRRHNYQQGGATLAISGGDMWTGPAVSTLTAGESMTDVLNQMGYVAAALGNHDFDFGPEVIAARAQQAEFPFISANLRQRSNGRTPPFARPYTVVEANGVRVALIGMTTVETPTDTRPYYAESFRFLPYAQALREVAPQAAEQSPDLMVVVGHVCHEQLRRVADLAAELNIPILTGGHCHERHNSEVAGTRLVESGYFLRGYVEIEVWVDLGAGRVDGLYAAVHDNPPGRQHAGLSRTVTQWHEQLDTHWTEPIGHAAAEIDRDSPLMDKLLTRAWLQAVPAAQVAIASRRYVQQSIPAGPISRGTVVGMLAVDNSLMQIELTGAQLKETLESRRPVVGGVQASEGGWMLANGKRLEDDQVVRVLLPDVIYYGANYYQVQQHDPEPLETGIDWRQPVIDYLIQLGTDEANPLQAALED